MRTDLRRGLLILFLTGALAVATFAVVTGQDALSAQFQPFVIDIQQRVPASVSIPVAAPDGTIVTATVPLTVNVQMKISVDGPQQARVEVERAPAPSIAIATATPPPSGAPEIGDAVLVGSLRWHVLEAEARGQTIRAEDNFSGPKTTAGKFIWVRFVVENVGTEPLDYGTPELVDGQGYRYEIISDYYSYVPDELQCSWTDNLNARVPLECAVIFEVAADASYLSLAASDLAPSARNREEVLIFVLP